MLGAPELDAVLQVGSHQGGVKGQNHLPRPAGHASLDAAQDTVGFPGCQRTLLVHVEFLINQYPQVLLLRAALEPPPAQPVLVFGIALTHVQDPALGLVELPAVHAGPPLQPVQVPLNGIPELHLIPRLSLQLYHHQILLVHPLSFSDASHPRKVSSVPYFSL